MKKHNNNKIIKIKQGWQPMFRERKVKTSNLMFYTQLKHVYQKSETANTTQVTQHNLDVGPDLSKWYVICESVRIFAGLTQSPKKSWFYWGYLFIFSPFWYHIVLTSIQFVIWKRRDLLIFFTNCCTVVTTCVFDLRPSTATVDAWWKAI